MKKLLTLALCTLSVSAFATTPSNEDQMSHPPRPPILEFPNWCFWLWRGKYDKACSK